MAKTLKSTSRRRRTRRTRQRGGKVIGQGGNGFAHYGKEGSEHVVCADGSEWKEGEVAKIGYGLTKEFTRVQKIRAHYPRISEFAILPTRLCPADPTHYKAFLDSQPESDTKMMLTEYTEGKPEILFSPYGGVTLKSVFMAPKGTYDSKKVLAALETLRDEVAAMNKNRVYHFDIGYSNILYKDDKAYLIDFGIADVVDEGEDTSNFLDLEEMNDIVAFASKRQGGRRSRRKGFQRKRL